MNPGDQLLMYGKKDQFDILHDINENVTSVQLMDDVGNINHAVSIVVYWLFESMTLDSLNLVRPPSVGEGMFSVLE